VSRGELGPGRYTLHSFLGALGLPGAPRRFSAILIDAGDVPLPFEVTNLFTQDPIPVELSCTITLRLSNAVDFLEKLFKGRISMSGHELRAFVFSELEEAARVAVGQHRIAELMHDPAVAGQLEAAMAGHLAPTLDRCGLKFVRLRTANYRNAKVEGVRELQAQYWLLVSREEAEVEGRKRLADVLSERELLDVAEQVRKVAAHEERARVWMRLRQVILSDRMDEVRNAEEWAKVVAEVDRARLLRESEVEALKHLLTEQAADRMAARAHLLARVDLERQRELRLGQIMLQADLEHAELVRAQENERLRVAGLMETEARRWTAELQRREQEVALRRAEQAAEDAARREREIKDALNELEIRRRKTQAQAEIDRIEREQDRLDTELGIVMLEKMKAVRRKEDEERQRMELERKAGEMRLAAEQEEWALERRLREAAERHRQQMEADRAAHEREVDWLQAISSLSVEALIVAASPDQARLLKELRETEALKGWTEEQILARAAERSPEVAKAFQEKYRVVAAAEGQARVEALYQQLLAEQKAAGKDLSEVQRGYARQMQEMFDKAMDTTRDIARATAEGQRGRQTVVVQPAVVGGPRVSLNGASPGEDEGGVCPRCQTPAPPGARYCKNCGEAL
jgi:hypothetical protein